MYYKTEWFEEFNHAFQRVFRAKDLPALWTAIKYMNMERRENGSPVIKQIQITVMN